MNSDVNVKKALVAVIVEGVLNSLSKGEYEEIICRLEDDYRCYITDVFEHPEYLKRVLEDIYGNAYKPILLKIEQALGEFTLQTPYKEFLLKLQ